MKANWKPDRMFPIPESVETASLSGFSTPPTPTSPMGSSHNDDNVEDQEHRVQMTPARSQQLRQYSDDYCTRSDDGAGLEDDDITMSTLTTATVSSHVQTGIIVEAEPVMIPSEHVLVLDDDMDAPVDDDTDPFSKTSQRVTID